MSENSCCPQCGSTVTYMGLSTVECTGTDCENNPGKDNIDWRGFIVKELKRRAAFRGGAQWTATQSKAKDPDPDADLVLDFLKQPVKITFHTDTMVVWPSLKSYKKYTDIRYTCKKNRDVP